MTSKKNDTVIISIKPVEKRTAKLRIVGDSSLIVHAWSEKARKEMLAAQQGEKKKKVKLEGRRAKNPYGEVAEALYWMDGKPSVAYEDWDEATLAQYAASARFGFPSCALKAAAVSAAYRIGATKDKVSARGAFQVYGEHGSELIEIKSYLPEGTPKFNPREDNVRIGMGTADLHYRPEFMNWYMDAYVTFNVNSGVTLEDIVNMLALGGDQCGLGEWRIEKGGSHGAFSVALTE